MNISRPEDAPSVFLLDESAEGASNKVPGLIFEAMATLRLDFDGPLQGRSDSSI
jgi:hypothetical protein